MYLILNLGLTLFGALSAWKTTPSDIADTKRIGHGITYPSSSSDLLKSPGCITAPRSRYDRPGENPAPHHEPVLCT